MLPATQLERARQYAGASKAESTIRAYRSEWGQFSKWCDAHNLTALPASPETVAVYAAELADKRKVATVEHHIVAIAQRHRTAGFPNPLA